MKGDKMQGLFLNINLNRQAKKVFNDREQMNGTEILYH